MSLLVFMSTDIYALGNVAFFASDYVRDEAEREGLKARVRQQVDGCWAMLEKRLASSGPWMMGRAFSALDLYVFMLSIWGSPSEEALHDRYPAVARLATAVRARPKLKAVLEAHGVLKTGGYVSAV